MKSKDEEMDAEEIVGMTFNMPESWHGEFKAMAALQNISMKQLLMECFDCWKKSEANCLVVSRKT